MTRKTARERFNDKLIPVTETGCYLWLGTILKDGYGIFWFNGKNVLAHRYSYVQSNGTIPPGLQLDHKCRVRCCVNPDHLEPVTCKENILRGLAPKIARERQLSKTHCPHGHPYSGKNLILRKNGKRQCRECVRIINARRSCA